MKSTDSSATPTHGFYAIECREGVIIACGADVEQSLVERRQHPRTGLVSTLEDITYGVLRRYDPIAETA